MKAAPWRGEFMSFNKNCVRAEKGGTKIDMRFTNVLVLLDAARGLFSADKFSVSSPWLLFFPTFIGPHKRRPRVRPRRRLSLFQ